MKILTVNCVYGQGSTGKIIRDIENSLKDNCVFYHAYEFGADIRSDNTYRICGGAEYRIYYALGRVLGRKYSTGYFSTKRLIRYVRKLKPDVIHMHCPNAGALHITRFLSFVRDEGIPLVVTHHAEFYYTGNCPHAFDCMQFQFGCGNCENEFDPYMKFLFDRTALEWRLMRNAFRNNRRALMVAVSPWMKERMKLSPIMDDLPSVVIKNGIDTKGTFFPRGRLIRRELGIPEEEHVVVHVTAEFTDNTVSLKGGHYVIEIARRMPEYRFVVVGASYVKDGSRLSENIMMVGMVADQEKLAEYYSMADLTLATSKRETYGMSCAESLSCGTPVVGFKCGGMESIALEKFSEFVDYGDVDALESAMKRWIERKADIESSIRRAASEEYSSERMAEGYYTAYEQVMRMC